MKHTPQLSSRGVRCRAQWVWNTNAHPLRIHTVRVLRLISWIQIGQNAYIALPCTNRCGEPSSQSIDLRIHTIGKWKLLPDNNVEKNASLLDTGDQF